MGVEEDGGREAEGKAIAEGAPLVAAAQRMTSLHRLASTLQPARCATTRDKLDSTLFLPCAIS
jgi:hypothetical protein